MTEYIKRRQDASNQRIFCPHRPQRDASLGWQRPERRSCVENAVGAKDGVGLPRASLTVADQAGVEAVERANHRVVRRLSPHRLLPRAFVEDCTEVEWSKTLARHVHHRLALLDGKEPSVAVPPLLHLSLSTTVLVVVHNSAPSPSPSVVRVIVLHCRAQRCSLIPRSHATTAACRLQIPAVLLGHVLLLVAVGFP